MMKKLFHDIYYILGKIICNCVLAFRKIIDVVSPPETDSILFVAHPDDDTLFFNKYILENKPYVVLLFTGWSIKRFKDYLKVMKHYGVRYRAYATLSADAYNNSKRRALTEKHIASSLNTGNYKTVLTHNSTGEYGHSTHKLVHECVVKVCENKPYDILCPVGISEISNYPLTQEEVEQKAFIFKTMYKSEAWVMTDEAAGTPVWFYNECLKRFNYKVG